MYIYSVYIYSVYIYIVYIYNIHMLYNLTIIWHHLRVSTVWVYGLRGAKRDIRSDLSGEDFSEWWRDSGNGDSNIFQDTVQFCMSKGSLHLINSLISSRPPSRWENGTCATAGMWGMARWHGMVVMDDSSSWLVVWNMAFMTSISYMGCHPSHWRTTFIFFRGAAKNHQPAFVLVSLRIGDRHFGTCFGCQFPTCGTCTKMKLDVRQRQAASKHRTLWLHSMCQKVSRLCHFAGRASPVVTSSSFSLSGLKAPADIWQDDASAYWIDGKAYFQLYKYRF